MRNLRRLSDVDWNGTGYMDTRSYSFWSRGIVWRYLRMDERHEADGWEAGNCQQQ